MENMYVQFVKKQSMHGVVTMKTLQTLQISYRVVEANYTEHSKHEQYHQLGEAGKQEFIFKKKVF